MRTVSVTLDSKVDIYAIMYGGRDILDKHIRKALKRNVFKAHVIVKDARKGQKVMEFDWHDPRYAAQPTNPVRERELASTVQHYDGMELTLDRSEWAAVAPETTMTWDFGNDDSTNRWTSFITPYLFTSLGLGIVHPHHRVVYGDVSA